MILGWFQAMTILAVGIVYYIADFLLIHRFDKLRAEEGSGRSPIYTAVIMIALILLSVQPIVLPSLSLHIESNWGLVLQGIGIVLLCAALALHWWARFCLQQFYVEDVVYQKNHHLIESGPYQWIRHPVFTSFFMIAIGLLLVNPAVTTFLGAIYAFIDFSKAARAEEALLSEKLDGYADYIKRTGRFLPTLKNRGK
jgi:protein-S-isoprenylcysteine O-methyltransferase Ste14